MSEIEEGMKVPLDVFNKTTKMTQSEDMNEMELLANEIRTHFTKE